MATAVVDLNAITHNLSVVRSLLNPDTFVMPAVKANAYGHGAVPTVRALEEAGVKWFAVATAAELIELREAGVTAELLLLTPALERIEELVEAGTVFTLPDYATLERLTRRGVARGARVHVKVDTGLGRLGLPPAEAAELAAEAERSGLVVQGLFSHFAAAEDNPELTALQLERFNETGGLLARHGISPEVRHICNSAGILTLAEAGCNMVRPGLLCYGYSPVAGEHPLAGRLRKALTLLAPVTQVKRVPAGTGLGYNHLHTTTAVTNILTVRCGYGDGYRRLLSNRSWASLHGERLPVRGRVAMDQLLLEAGDLKAEPGELVTMIGGRGPGADELGELAESNAYDILTSLTHRVNRQFTRNGC